MVTSKNFVFSRAAVARMLGIASILVKKVEKWANCIFVIVVGRKPRFWKKSDFQNHFVDHRKEQSTYYNVTERNNGEFEAWNNTKSYKLQALTETIVCPCEDYANQQRIFKGRGCCKHGYAVLRVLGFDRLSDYINEHLWVSNKDDKFIDEPDYYDQARIDIFGY